MVEEEHPPAPVDGAAPPAESWAVNERDAFLTALLALDTRNLAAADRLRERYCLTCKASAASGATRERRHAECYASLCGMCERRTLADLQGFIGEKLAHFAVPRPIAPDDAHMADLFETLDHAGSATLTLRRSPGGWLQTAVYARTLRALGFAAIIGKLAGEYGEIVIVAPDVSAAAAKGQVSQTRAAITEAQKLEAARLRATGMSDVKIQRALGLSDRSLIRQWLGKQKK